MKNLKIAALASAIFINNNIALASNADDRYLYIGTEFGISEPVVKSFVYNSHEGETTMRLKQSRMIGGRVGYSFYPNMSIEISGTHQPKYRLGYTLPAVDLTSTIQQMVAGSLIAGGDTEAVAAAKAAAAFPSAEIPITSDITKVTANVFTLNLLYEFGEKKFGLNPYVIFGAGIAQISIKPKGTLWKPAGNLATLPGLGEPLEFFRVKKNTSNYFAYQFGGGISKNINKYFAIDLGAKLQVVKDIKIKYETMDMTAGGFKSQQPIKKTIGVGEFTLGFTLKIPVK